MTEFKTTDFVQVLYNIVNPDGEPIEYWRNGLYVMNDSGSHVVIYASGEKHMLHSDIKIRKVRNQD